MSKEGKPGNNAPETKKEYVKKEQADSGSHEESSHDYGDVDKEPCDFFCRMCGAQMNSPRTWFMHIEGKRHQKKKASVFAKKGKRVAPPVDGKLQMLKVAGGPLLLPTKPSSREAEIQKTLDKVLHTPVVGLDYVTEIWRKEPFMEPVYHCKLCNADCQLITIVKHITGYRHHLNYIKVKDPNKYQRFANSYEKQSHLSDIAVRFVRDMERAYGSGHVRVEIETAAETDESDQEDDMYAAGPSTRGQAPTLKVEKSEEASTRKHTQQATTSKATAKPPPPPIDLIFKKLTASDRLNSLSAFPRKRWPRKFEVSDRMRREMNDTFFKTVVGRMSYSQKINVAGQLMCDNFSFLKQFEGDVFAPNCLPNPALPPAN